MEHLSQTKGKGVLMFEKRRQRMDELSEEQEEMRRKGIPVEPEREIVKPPPQESKQAPQDVYVRQQQYQEQSFQQQMLQQSANGMNGLDPYQGSSVLRPLVSNRTAKPFLGGHNQGQKTFAPVRGVSSPTHKKPETIFKVPVPVNTTPQVWSPTSDIIASRDERIAIPAIKTGILPETKRRGANKTDLKDMPPVQKKGDQKALTESALEEDFLSLGAEACNFMQVPMVRQKKPPPVLPKPVINPAHPPWSTEGHAVSGSPRAESSTVPAMVHTQMQAVPQQTLPKLEPAGKTQFSSQRTPQQVSPVWIAAHSPDQHQSAWNPEPRQAQHTPDSLRAGPSQSKPSWIRSQNDGNSIASCPPQQPSTYFQGSKAPSASTKVYSSNAGSSEKLNLKGKGAELFARRQSRMEKFVVDDETVQSNKARPSSPTLSMPSTWKYSSNVRAPPPASYNPILTPFYPLAAVKQPPPATSPKIKPKASKEKTKPPPKHLNALDVMKHQPYQLNPSLFTYNSTPEAKETSDQTQSLANEPSPSPNSFSKCSLPVKQNPSKATGEGFSRSRSLSFPQTLSSVSPTSQVSTPGVHPTREALNRQYSWVEQPKKLSSLETQSPFSLNEAKMSVTHRKSLPETPAEWKERVFYESLDDLKEMEPVIAATSRYTSSFSSLPNEVVYGQPFRPSQPLTSSRYRRGSSLPRNFTPHSNYPQLHRVSWKL